MKLIKISSKKYPGLYTKVSDCDYEWLNQYKWSRINGNGWIYVCKRFYINKKSVAISMASEIMKPPSGIKVDHINHDTFDNQRENLRMCTHGENMRNRQKQKNNTSGIIGVHYCNTYKIWKAQIRINKKRIALGSFVCPLIAMLSRKQAEHKYFGEFAYNG